MMAILQLEACNARAASIINRYAEIHRRMNMSVVLASLLPGATIPAMIAATALPALAIYQPMARELAHLYLGTPGSPPSPALKMAAHQFAAEFNPASATRMTGGLVSGMGMQAVSNFLPLATTCVSASLDFASSVKLTRRIGAMMSIYFQNGGQWVVSKLATFELAKDVGPDLAFRTAPTALPSPFQDRQSQSE